MQTSFDVWNPRSRPISRRHFHHSNRHQLPRTRMTGEPHGCRRKTRKTDQMSDPQTVGFTCSPPLSSGPLHPGSWERESIKDIPTWLTNNRNGDIPHCQPHRYARCQHGYSAYPPKVLHRSAKIMLIPDNNDCMLIPHGWQ